MFFRVWIIRICICLPIICSMKTRQIICCGWSVAIVQESISPQTVREQGVSERKGSQWLNVTKPSFDSWVLPSKPRARHWATVSLYGGVRTAGGTSGVPASSPHAWWWHVIWNSSEWPQQHTHEHTPSHRLVACWARVQGSGCCLRSFRVSIWGG